MLSRRAALRCLALTAFVGGCGRSAQVSSPAPAVPAAQTMAITDGESASALSRMTNVDLATGRQIVVRLAQFARFRGGKVCEFCSITDTLGAAEQFMGRSLSQMAEDAPALAEV